MIVALLTTSLDLTAIAAEVTAVQDTEDSLYIDPEMEDMVGPVDKEAEEEGEPLILGEITAERTEESKTFLMDNGCYIMAQYGIPVHYEETDGSWQEIDTTLEESEEEYETTQKAGKRPVISFSKKLKEGKTVSIKHTEYPLSWGISGALHQEISLGEQEQSEKTGNQKFLAVSGLNQRVLYKDIFEGVDVEYILTSADIKENLILKQPGTRTEFDIEYSIGSLEAVQKDERTIVLADGESVIYEIQAPHMEDAAGARSEALTIQITETKNKKLTVQLQADSEWLQEETREYPVIIDPYVLTETTKSDIDTTFITSGAAGTNHSDKLELLVGKESSSYQNCRTLINIDMPELGAGDMVVDAKLRLYLYKSDFYSTTTPNLQVNAHQVTSSWKMSSVTWNTRPSYDSRVLDFVHIGQQSINDAAVGKIFDITEAVKSWYEQDAPNYGIMLKSYNESGSYADAGVKAYFWPERYNSVNDAYPLIQITYRNNKGLEDYWTYTSVSAGRAGTAYVNDYSGNLVFVHDDASTTGQILPTSLQHVYNGYMSGNKYLTTYPTDGRGWKLSMQQTLVSASKYGLSGEALEDYPYAYEDGDGTVHFFYKKVENSVTKYLDEDGLGLELTISGNTKTITDKEDNEMNFNAKGNLTSIKDARGNTITISYTTAADGVEAISSITDGAGHVITLTLTSNGYYQLYKVTAPDGKETEYSYTPGEANLENSNAPSSGYLTMVEYPDGTKSEYFYDADGALSRAVSPDGSGLIFSYTSKESGKRVNAVTEFGTDGTEGQTISFDRSGYNTTVTRTAGTDDVYGNSDDYLTTYQFDDYGRTTGQGTKTVGGEDFGGDVYTYSTGAVDSTGSNLKKINKLTSSSYSGKNVSNYLENHSGETDSIWYDLTWVYENSVYTAARTTEERLFGEYSYKLTGVTIPNNGGGCYSQKLYTDELKPGSTYTFSGYIKTDSVVKANASTNGYGANLAVRFTSSSGAYTRIYSNFIKGTTPENVNDGWQRVAVTFTVPANCTETRVSLLLRNALGTAYFDGMQVEEGDHANSYNLFENASFEQGDSANKATGWSRVNLTSSDVIYATDTIQGSYAMKLVGAGTTNKRVFQHVYVGGEESDIYILSCWAKADAVKNAVGIEKNFDLYARVYYSDGTSCLKSITAKYNRDISDWQKASMAFDLSDGNDSTTKIPSYVSIGLRYYKQANTAYFDNVQLVKDISNSYTYDKDGNIIKTSESGKQSSELTYNSNSDLTSVKDAKNNIYQYSYNDTHQVTEAVSPMGQKIQFSYNDQGSVTTSKITDSSGELVLESGTEYNTAADGIAAGAYAVKSVDQNGKATEYAYDLQSGLLNSVEDPDGTETSYSYDATTDLLTKVTAAGSTVDYEYNDSKTRLTSILHNGFRYGFLYDVYGNVLSTSAGGSILSTNVYTAGNGKLRSVAYGNGDTVEYSYNNAGSVSEVKNNGETVEAYKYDASQRVTESIDYAANRKYFYDYDMIGRISDIKIRKNSATATYMDHTLYEKSYGYDELNNVSEENLTVGGRTYSTSYSYNADNQPEKMTAGKEIRYGYDSLGRLSSRTVATDVPVKNTYEYQTSERNGEGEDKYTTSLLSRESAGGKTYAYTYDSRGNILTIREGTQNAGPTVSYQYDSLNQLVREDNSYLGRTIVYSYDAGGNLTQRKEYAYTTATDLSSLTPADTIVYSYDSTWKDKLVGYDGTSITYDSIGNPLTYLGKTLTWEGRKLESLTTGGTTISYTYDTDGIRTKKMVGDTESVYYYDNGYLDYEKRGTQELWYFYDSFGNLSVLNYHDGNGNYTTYYVVTNSRGDVEGLYNTAGGLVAGYVYDSWGNVISVSDASGNEITATNHIGNINPIRYRGYYYDAETGFYYVSSRYYDPEVGRFLNADGQINNDILGCNLYAYCGNNPVMRADDSGEGWWVAACAIVGGLVGGVARVASNVATGKKWNKGVLGAVAGGATAGAIFAVTGDAVVSSYTGALVESAVNEFVSYRPQLSKANGRSKPKKATNINISNSLKTVCKDTAVNGTLSLMTGNMAGNVGYVNSKWIKPQKFKSSFIGNYAKKAHGQSAVQGSFDATVNMMMDLQSFLGYGQTGQNAIVTLYPIMQVGPAR